MNRPVVVINARADAMLQPKMRTKVSSQLKAATAIANDFLCPILRLLDLPGI